MRFGLESNPFEWASHDHKMADRQAEWKTITEVLNSAYKGQTCRFVLALGDYGMGKSFTLYQIYKHATGTQGVLAVKDVLTEKPIATRSLIRTMPEFDIPSRIIRNLGKDKIVEILRATVGKKPDFPFKSVFEKLVEGNDLAWNYIVGERLRRVELDELGLRMPLPRPDGTIEMMFEILKMIRLAGYHSVLVLVDEFEAIMSKLGGKAAVAVLDALRAIFDEFGPVRTLAAKLIFVFGVSAQAWDKVVNLEQTMIAKTGGGGISPFVERILPTDKITLTPFTLDNAIELVQSRLTEARGSGGFDPLHPFTRDAVEFVYSLSREKPRLILQYCYILLERASEREEVSLVTRDFAERTLKEFNIVPAE